MNDYPFLRGVAGIPIEPDADTRTSAIAMRTMFLALVEQGFTDDQALKMVALIAVAANDAQKGER